MDSFNTLHLATESLFLVLLVSLPVLLGSVVVGLVVSIFQATTQLQDQTLTFVPKLLSVTLILAMVGGWMGAEISSFTTDLWTGLHLIH